MPLISLLFNEIMEVVASTEERKDVGKKKKIPLIKHKAISTKLSKNVLKIKKKNHHYLQNIICIEKSKIIYSKIIRTKSRRR